MFGLFKGKSSGMSLGPQYYDIEKVNNYSNHEVLVALKKYHNIDLRSVQELNKLLCEMGIVEKSNGRWLLTEYGRIGFTGSNSCRYNPNLWHKNIVDTIAAYYSANVRS